MISPRRGWVTAGDIVLPRLRRGRLAEATRPPGIQLTPVQEQALQLKSAHGEVRRADLIARCRVSHDVARRALAGLARLGLLRRVGLARATRLAEPYGRGCSGGDARLGLRPESQRTAWTPGYPSGLRKRRKSR